LLLNLWFPFFILKLLSLLFTCFTILAGLLLSGYRLILEDCQLFALFLSALAALVYTSGRLSFLGVHLFFVVISIQLPHKVVHQLFWILLFALVALASTRLRLIFCLVLFLLNLLFFYLFVLLLFSLARD
jgi:hypothetical protein